VLDTTGYAARSAREAVWPESGHSLLETPIVGHACDHPVSHSLLAPVRLSPRASPGRLRVGTGQVSRRRR
jgi:hypothetical protein